VEGYEARRERFIQDALALVPAALEGLERAGWPRGSLMKVRGFLRSKEVAAWPAGGYRFEIPDATLGHGLFNKLYFTQRRALGLRPWCEA